jgi:hypothetical protein
MIEFFGHLDLYLRLSQTRRAKAIRRRYRRYFGISRRNAWRPAVVVGIQVLASLAEAATLTDPQSPLIGPGKASINSSSPTQYSAASLAWPSQLRAPIRDEDISIVSQRCGLHGELGVIESGRCRVPDQAIQRRGAVERHP